MHNCLRRWTESCPIGNRILFSSPRSPPEYLSPSWYSATWTLLPWPSKTLNCISSQSPVHSAWICPLQSGHAFEALCCGYFRVFLIYFPPLRDHSLQRLKYSILQIILSCILYTFSCFSLGVNLLPVLSSYLEAKVYKLFYLGNSNHSK